LVKAINSEFVCDPELDLKGVIRIVFLLTRLAFVTDQLDTLLIDLFDAFESIKLLLFSGSGLFLYTELRVLGVFNMAV